MTGRRCKRRKMMGRGVEGGCGTEEKPCPVSRVSSSSTKIPANNQLSTSVQRDESFGLDLYVQARKALSERSPYDTEEAVLSRVPTLPVGLSGFLTKNYESRKRYKKSHSESAAKSSGHGSIAQTPVLLNIWAENEDYFRPVALTDIENLVVVSSIDSSDIQGCLTIPSVSGATVRTCDNAIEVSTSPQKNEEVGVEEEQFMEIDGEGADVLAQNETGVLQNEMGSSVRPSSPWGAGILPQAEKGSSVTELSSPPSSGLQWLLGSKNKILLTSERPSKKRKLLGGDAGLERLVIGQPSEGVGSPICHVCCLGDNNRMLVCDSCKVSVHQNCYGVETFPDGPWLCSWCKLKGDVENDLAGNVAVENGTDVWLRPCELCPKQGGALKPIAKGVPETKDSDTVKFAHLFCCQWLPEVYVQDLRMMEPIMNVEGIKETRKKLVCYLCKVKYGACIRCSNGTCRTSFHPICAREAKHRMEIWGKIETDNVELRAFCSKHSVCQDTAVMQQPSSPLSVFGGCEFSLSQPSPLALVESEPHKLRHGIKNAEQSMVHCKATDGDCNKSEDVEGTEPGSRCRSDSADVQLITMEALGRNSNEDSGSIDSLDSVQILKKIIDRGKAFVHDVALEIGISSESLAATLAGERPFCFPDLQSKIIKWLGNHAYMGNSLKNLKSRSNSTNSSRAAVAGSDGPNGIAIADSSHSDAVPVKSVPPRRRTKNNIRILKDKKVLSSSEETFIEQNDDGIVINEFSRQQLGLDEEFNDGSGNESLSHNGDCCEDPHVTGKIRMEPLGHQEVGSFVESPRSEAVGSHSSILKNVQAYNVDSSVVNTLVDSNGEDPACAADSATPVMRNLDGEVSSTSYIHPFILKRMMQMQSPMGKSISSIEAYGPVNVCCNRLHQPSVCISKNPASDSLKLEQLIKASSMGIMEYSPEDEVEGELIYFQNKLVDLAVSSKRYCDDLIFRVAKSLPEEMDAVRNKKWDAVLVNQYLCELREEKKRGRKEKRHKEAQAVLAAAAASSRVSLFRKDGQDEAGQHENPLKVNTVSGRAGPHSQLMPRAKETLSRLAVSRASSEKQSNIFQLTSDFSKDNPRSCDVCRRSETMLNPVLVCCYCKVAVHLGCYRNVKDPVGPWYCEVCEELLPSRSPGAVPSNSMERPYFIIQCGLCGGSAGAFRKSPDGQWVHAFCAEWILESTFRKGQVNAVEGMEAILKERDACIICRRRVGVCIKCNYGNCQSTFHPFCARNAGLYLHVKISGGRVQHKGYCDRHSMEQKEKAETQQHGAEELKSIKQIRVELEKLRLLCERIIRREKLKRELVICSHDILASKRDAVAFSVLVNSPFVPPDVSSESATTSLKGHDENKSFSEAFQRSDDVSVDSTVSGKRRFTIPMPMDMDQQTNESLTSQRSAARLVTESLPFSGKQLPNRPVSIASRNLTDDVERKSKLRKHTETFQKELVMTSDQASVQNQRLPKGFAYVPIGCLSKEKLVARDVSSHAPLKRDG
ncbi:uncharacterized protein LOC122660988 isoform X2 [Telopea speciosissima]|uniref:uncharacterized protein LOC122660988 isoform X2 n=1 Tax=Telopea speciosissima TaxID=54955 RepID=UPI001CC60883|nr:uncharacterized protein LOC122660988 isoform X2 [Telopea speciosissima]